jgi:phosphoribosylglycinamide formyltransferase 1
MTERLPVVILISGRGGNMCALADHARNEKLPLDIRAVVSDRGDAQGLHRAEERGIATSVVSLRDCGTREAFDNKLSEVVTGYAPELVILAGYMKILNSAFVRRFSGRLLNIHPSLLPKYPGLKTHRRVLEAGDAIHGASVHFVIEELDSGPIIIQGSVPTRPGDTEESLAARVQRVEHIIYPEAVEWFARGRIQLRAGAVWLDGNALNAPVLKHFDR